ncbi:MAG TPA: helix-turn-helix domain-containing protein [Kineosporiaceae bacterium]|nr:helix-turn-helix domain-containing protein [Kineosporiaceae bacterium]
MLIDRDRRAVAALGSSRSRVLEVLREAGGPLGVQEIAALTGLHANTARFHLDALIEARLVDRACEERTQRGRPRVVFQATPAAEEAGQPNYRLLAEMLTGLIASVLPKSERAAVEAGEGWGRLLAQPPLHRVDALEGISRLSAILADAGFAPEAAGNSTAPVIRLRHCPFREIAIEYPELVCSLHLGLIRGVLSELRAPVAAERLEAFVEPSLCLAHLAPTAAG